MFTKQVSFCCRKYLQSLLCVVCLKRIGTSDQANAVFNITDMVNACAECSTRFAAREDAQPLLEFCKLCTARH